jgi:hypothetical protein
MGSTTADNSSMNGVDTLSVPASSSYNDPGAIVQSDSGNQSVHTTVTHGTQGTVQTAPNSGNATISSVGSRNAHHTTGSNPSSPHRGNDVTIITTNPIGTSPPKNTSPASSAGRSQVHSDVVGTVELMPQYGGHQPHHHQQRPQMHLQQQQQQHYAHPQHADIFFVQQQQQQQIQQQHHYQQQQQQQVVVAGLHQPYPTHRERSNPVSELDTDDLTEPSTSANTGAGETGYTRSDHAVVGATSTFGRFIQSATRVSD